MTRGYFGIGVYHPKTEVNIGTLWRHATLYGAAFIFTIGKRYAKQHADTTQASRHLPLINYPTWEVFHEARPYDAPLVCIELVDGAISLPTFQHPERAIYLLGAEDHGLPSSVLDEAQHTVIIPCLKPQSMNVATAGTLVMYDRYLKRGPNNPNQTLIDKNGSAR